MRFQGILWYIVGLLVLVSATVHLTVGIMSFLNPDLRIVADTILALLFLLTAILLYGFLSLAALTRINQRLLAGVGIGLMVVLLVAYVDWHVIGTVESVIPGDGFSHDHSHSSDHGHGHGHEHGSHASQDDLGSHHGQPGALAVLADHLIEDPFALVAKVSEALAIVGFAIIVLVSPSSDDEPTP